ncbi:MAG: hypothetical protein QNJ98_03610 [Planctomycetota bacterium]|nr:hypothetical protein [Planctomycetota bacterium]
MNDEMEGGLREPDVGDVTIVPYPRVREQIGCAEEAGLLMEDRRNVLRVFFPGTARTFWLDRDKVTAVDADQLPLHPLVERLHKIARRVDAVLIEEQESEAGEEAYNVYAPSMTLPDLLYVRDLLGDELVGLEIAAGSVRRVKLVLRFRLPS